MYVWCSMVYICMHTLASLVCSMFEAPSDYLPSFDGRPVQLGIDEAGRGPVVGPMVYGCAYGPIDQAAVVAAAGFADSKQLTEPRREALWGQIVSGDGSIGYIVNMLSASSISGQMLRRNAHNLNAISHDAAISMIRKVLDAGAKVEEVFVDTVGDPVRYASRLKSLFPNIRSIIVCPKADSIYPIVSAASICAKVNRDRAVACIGDIMEEPEHIRNKMNSVPLGSGYPSDERTKEWLRAMIDQVFLFPKIVRFSWDTVNQLAAGKCVEFDFHDTDDEQTHSIAQMMKKSSYTKSGGRPVSKLFTHRGLV